MFRVFVLVLSCFFLFAGSFGLALPRLSYTMFIKNINEPTAIEIGAFRLIAMLEICLGIILWTIKDETEKSKQRKYLQAIFLILLLHVLVHSFQYFFLELYLSDAIISGVGIPFAFLLVWFCVK